MHMLVPQSIAYQEGFVSSKMKKNYRVGVQETRKQLSRIQQKSKSS